MRTKELEDVFSFTGLNRLKKKCRRLLLQQSEKKRCRQRVSRETRMDEPNEEKVKLGKGENANAEKEGGGNKQKQRVYTNKQARER